MYTIAVTTNFDVLYKINFNDYRQVFLFTVSNNLNSVEIKICFFAAYIIFTFIYFNFIDVLELHAQSPTSSDTDTDTGSKSDRVSEPEANPAEYLGHDCGCDHLAGTPCTNCPGDAHAPWSTEYPGDNSRTVERHVGQGQDKHFWERSERNGVCTTTIIIVVLVGML